MKFYTVLFRFFILILFLLSIPAGCGGPKRPADWPDLYPCKIIVTKGGQPFVDAMVSLANPGGTANYAVGGATDSTGTAVMRTSWPGVVDEGAPAGEFKVCITKSNAIQVDAAKRAELDKMDYGQRVAESDRMSKELAAKALLVPVALTQGETTPLTVTVGTSGAELKVEIDDYK